jgi:hypothetical protein
MKVRKGAVTLWVPVLLAMITVSGCSPVTVETPVPTPDIAATVEAAVAAALVSQLTPDLAATVKAAVATEVAATQVAQEPTATPTPVPPTAMPEATDTPAVGPTDTPILTDTPTATPTATTQVEPACVSPTIEFTGVPPYGSPFKDLEGRVACVEPADYKVAVYIYVDGWYNKPYFADRLTTIRSDGTWTTITPAKYDHLATKIAAFLVPNGYNPPKMEGAQTLPAELFENSVAHVMEEREHTSRTIEFSGYT